MKLRLLGAVAALIAFSVSSVWATTITYEVNNIAGNTWEYIYTVSNDTLGIAIEEFTILFDVGDYGNLVVTTTPVDWIRWLFNQTPIYQTMGSTMHSN